MTSDRKIDYLASPTKVNMADRWFEIASIDHFWIRRRFQVFQRLAGTLIASAREIAEAGCGHGLLQLQVENAYGKPVIGFDLNDFALKQNVSSFSAICCYDVCQKAVSFRNRFDLILLFDVLEHIADEDKFLSALMYHLAPKGKIVVNVPAGHWAYSKYDQAAGHVRRYTIGSMRETAQRNNLKIANWTYWGLPLLLPLLIRKLWLIGNKDKDKIISTGFDSRTDGINNLLGVASQCEPIPQKIIGSSLMVVLQNGSEDG